MKSTIKLTESELKRVINESIKNILNEIGDSEESRSNIRKAVKDDSAKRIKGLMKGTYKSENFTDKNGKKWVSRKAARNQNILDNLNKKGEKESNREKVVSEGMSYRLTESELKKVISESVKNILFFEHEEMIPEYIPLETKIGYDWDDYDVYADVLYNTRTKSIEIEKYGHGMGPSIEGSGDIESAIQNGLCDEMDVRMALIERLSAYLIPNHNTVSIALESLVGEKLAIPCKVSRSRNIKGDCILLQVVEKRNNFRPYYGRSFDSRYDTYFQVYSEATNTIAEVGVNTVSFSDDVIENIKNEAINVLMSMNLQTLIHLCAYKLSYAAVDSQKLARYGRQACLTAIQNLYGKEYNIPDNVVNPQQAKKDEKQKAFKEKKMPELIAWAKSVHPDWSEEEINALAEKVWNKRYA